MAKMGAAYFALAPIATESASAAMTYGAGFQVGGLNQVDRKISYVEAELPADDTVKYKYKKFKAGDLGVKLSEFSLENQAVVFGQTLVDGKLSKRSSDEPPYCGAGYVQTVVRKNGANNETVYKVFINPKTQSYPGDESSKTKGGNVTLDTHDFSATIFEPLYDEWEVNKEFSTFASAMGYVQNYLGIATWYAVDVQVNGAGAGESGSPAGVTMVASGEAFELTIAGTATKLYDNGSDVTASIAAGKYTIATVSAAHKIALIYS
jgi:phi13 family phage major tail protein